MTTFDTRNGHVTIDTATHKAVPKDAVVLDIGSAVPHVVVGVLRAAAYDDLADQIEAQTKPARIPEPGLWGVVHASFGGLSTAREFVRYPDGWRGDAYEPVAWDDLVDPTLIREGVES